MYSESSAKNPYDTPPTQPTRDDVFDDKDTKTQSIRPTSVSRPYDFEVPSGLHDSKGRQNSGNSGYDTPADYNQNQYSTKGLNDSQDAGLVANASAMPRSDNYHDLEYADPVDTNRNAATVEKGPLAALMTKAGFTPPAGRYPLEQRIEDKKRGIGRQRYPFVVWALTVAMLGVFIKELVLNSQEQGTPLSFKPVVNYMLGPSSSALINLGARFPACMKDVAEVPLSLTLPCMNDTSATSFCSIGELCGFGGIPVDQEPNQWFRFIVPIFLHAGIVHIALNMLAQLSVSAQVEREMGSGGFLLTYFAAGIFGNVLGGNFSLVGSPSVGASGAIFGTLAVKWVDLAAHWNYHYRPVRLLIFMTIELAIGVAIGYIPFVDNFAHIGGFIMGLIFATIFYPVISPTKRHKLITWGFRIAAIPVAIILFVVLTRNFYTANPYAACDGCRYLSCWPTASNNHCKGTGLTTTTVTTGN